MRSNNAIGRTLGLAAAVIMSCGLLAQSVLAEPMIATRAKIQAGGIYEIVVAPDSETVYVAATGQRGVPDSARIVALDAGTLQVKREYNVSQAPFYGLGLNEKTGMLYGTVTRDGKVGVLDLDSGEMVAMIGREDNAHVRQLVVDEDSNTVYVSVVGSRRADAENPVPSELWIIDGSTNTLSRTIEPEGTLTGLAVDKEAGRAYMTDMNNNRVLAIDLVSGETVGNWPSGGESAINVSVDPASGRLFVANQGSGTLTVLNAETGELLETVETGEGALSVLYNAEANQIYVANRRAGTTSVVDGDSYEVLSNLETGTYPQTLAMNPETNAIYISNKARGLPRNAPADAEPVVDENGDTVVRIQP